jgi:hypothetical protein
MSNGMHTISKQEIIRMIHLYKETDMATATMLWIILKQEKDGVIYMPLNKLLIEARMAQKAGLHAWSKIVASWAEMAQA